MKNTTVRNGSDGFGPRSWAPTTASCRPPARSWASAPSSAPSSSATSRKYPGIRSPLPPLQLRCAPDADRGISYRLSRVPQGAYFVREWGAPCAVLSQYASVACLAGAAHRRSRCVRLFARRCTRDQETIRRKRSRNTGSNSVPRPSRRIPRVVSWSRLGRYGRWVLRASYTSATCVMRETGWSASV